MSSESGKPVKDGTFIAKLIGRLIAEPIEPEPHPNPLNPKEPVEPGGPSKEFVAGVEAHQKASRMDIPYGEAYGLGEYVEVRGASESVEMMEDVGGRAVAVKFPLFWRRWIAQQTPQTLDAMTRSARERLDREAAARVNKRWIWAAWAAFAGAIYFAKYILEQIFWVIEKLPALKQAWSSIFGGG